MTPIVFPLTFDEGVLGSADFTVSNDLPVTSAKITIFPRGDYEAVTKLTLTCTIVSNTIRVRVPGLDSDTFGPGRHTYQLDALSAGEAVRIARGELSIVPGVRTTFS